MDATYSAGLGRLVNDAEARIANCLIKKIVINGRPHLAIYAKRNLSINEELRYDYGVKDLPWRIQKGINGANYKINSFKLTLNMTEQPDECVKGWSELQVYLVCFNCLPRELGFFHRTEDGNSKNKNKVFQLT